MPNLKKLKDPVQLITRVEKMTREQLRLRAISKGISVNDLCRRYLKEGLKRDQDI